MAGDPNVRFKAMLRYSLARLMGVILVVAITLGVVRFLGPLGLVVAGGALLASLFPVIASKRRGLDPTIGICAVAGGAFGGMVAGNLAGESAIQDRPLFVGLDAFLGGIYWLTSVWVRLSDQRAEPTTQDARPSKYLVLTGLALICGPLLPAMLFAVALMFNDDLKLDLWGNLKHLMVVGLVGGSLFAVPCFLAWLLQVGRQRRARQLPPP